MPEVVVTITPTYSGCPAMGQIDGRPDAPEPLLETACRPVVGEVRTVLSPAWTTDWMTPTAREKLRAYGIAPPQCGATPTGHANVIRFAPPPGSTPAIACPQCGSSRTTETSPFGSTACKALYRCLDCLEPFDYFKPY